MVNAAACKTVARVALVVRIHPGALASFADTHGLRLRPCKANDPARHRMSAPFDPGWVVWHPARPLKPGHAGSIPAPGTMPS